MASRDILLAEANATEYGDHDAPVSNASSVSEGYGVKPVASALKPGLGGNPFKTSLPCGMSGPERAVDRVLGDAHLSAVAVKNISERHRFMEDADRRVALGLLNCPIPHGRKAPQAL